MSSILQTAIQDAVNKALGLDNSSASGHPPNISAEPVPVVVCTDKRGVVFGLTNNPHSDPIVLQDARMCLYWDKATGGVFGLSENGPTPGCKISATTDRVCLTGITAVFDMTDKAVAAWSSAPVQGR